MDDATDDESTEDDETGKLDKLVDVVMELLDLF